MKKAILLSVVLAMAFVSCGTSPKRMEHISQVSREIDAGDYYVTQFNSFRDPAQQQRNESRPIRPTPTVLSTTRSGGSRSSENKYRPFRTSKPDWIRAEAPSEQDIDRAIAAYEEALRLEPSGTWVLRGEAADEYLYPPNGGIQARLENARRIKQQWLAEKQQREQQAARVLSTNISFRAFNAGVTKEDANFIYSTVNGQNYAVDKATRSNYRVWVNSAWQPANVGTAEERQEIVNQRTAYVQLYSGYAGTVLVNGQPTRFTARAGADTEVTIENASGQYTLAVRDSGGTIRQAVAAITVSATGPNNKYAAAVLDPNPSVNSPEDFDIAQNTDGGVTITNYKGTRKQVIIPDTLYGLRVTRIGSVAFFRKGLYSVVIPNTVITIENGDTSLLNPDLYGAFSQNNLVKVTFGNSLRTIGAFAFYSNRLTELTIPDSVTEIGFAAFYIGRIARITLGRSLRTIGAFAFRSNELESLSIPNGVTFIGRGAFVSNPLTTLIIPESLAVSSAERGIESFYMEAFDGGRLTRVTLPANFDRKNSSGIDENLMNYYVSQGLRAGTYVKNGPVWVRQ